MLPCRVSFLMTRQKKEIIINLLSSSCQSFVRVSFKGKHLSKWIWNNWRNKGILCLFKKITCKCCTLYILHFHHWSRNVIQSNYCDGMSWTLPWWCNTMKSNGHLTIPFEVRHINYFPSQADSLQAYLQSTIHMHSTRHCNKVLFVYFPNWKECDDI